MFVRRKSEFFPERKLFPNQHTFDDIVAILHQIKLPGAYPHLQAVVLAIAQVGHDHRIFHLDRHPVEQVVLLKQFELKHVQQTFRLFDIVAAGLIGYSCWFTCGFPFLPVVRRRIEDRQKEGHNMFARPRIAFEGRAGTIVIIDFCIFIQINLYFVLFCPFDICVKGIFSTVGCVLPQCPAFKQLHPFLEGRVAVCHILYFLHIVSH